MSTRTRIFTSCANEALVFDIGLLLQQLLLFDTVVISSNRLKELSSLVGMMGFDTATWLLNSGAIELEYWPGAAANVSTGSRNDFDLVIVRGQQQRQSSIERALRAPALKKGQQKIFERAVHRKLVSERPSNFGHVSLRATKKEFHGGGATARRAVANAAKIVGGRDINGDDLVLAFADGDTSALSGGRMVHAETNLVKLGFSEEVAHKTIERALLNVLGTNYRLEEMKLHRAATSFREDEIDLLRDRVAFLIDDANPDARREQLLRVMALRNLQDLSVAASANAIDYKRFRSIRDSDECDQFRRFLEDAATKDDKELRERFDSVAARIGTAVQSPKAKLVRFALTNIAGLLGTVPGLAATGVDLGIDRWVKKDGAAAFLDNMLPSIFNFR